MASSSDSGAGCAGMVLFFVIAPGYFIMKGNWGALSGWFITMVVPILLIIVAIIVLLWILAKIFS